MTTTAKPDRKWKEGKASPEMILRGEGNPKQNNAPNPNRTARTKPLGQHPDAQRWGR